MPKYRIRNQLVKDLGFRSKFEMIVNQQLVDSGISFSFEGDLHVIKYTKPVTHHRYLCDFLLSNGIMIETKGLFTAQDRKKHLLIKEQYPILDIRFLFMNANNKLNKRSKTTYAAWAEKKGFKWANRNLPQEWTKEVKPKDELAEIINLLKGFQ